MQFANADKSSRLTMAGMSARGTKLTVGNIRLARQVRGGKSDLTRTASHIENHAK